MRGLGSAPQIRHAAALAELEEQRALQLWDRLREAEIIGPGLRSNLFISAAIYAEQPEDERSGGHRKAG